MQDETLVTTRHNVLDILDQLETYAEQLGLKIELETTESSALVKTAMPDGTRRVLLNARRFSCSGPNEWTVTAPAGMLTVHQGADQ